MRGLSYDELAAAYVMRHGYATPTPWKRIAREFGVTANALRLAIYRLERNGLNLDANGDKPLSRVTKISNAQIELIDAERKDGNSWVAIARAIGVSVDTLKSRYRRSKQKTHP